MTAGGWSLPELDGLQLVLAAVLLARIERDDAFQRLNGVRLLTASRLGVEGCRNGMGYCHISHVTDTVTVPHL